MASRKPGKYDHVLAGLPAAAPEDADRQTTINVLRDQIRDGDTPPSLLHRGRVALDATNAVYAQLTSDALPDLAEARRLILDAKEATAELASAIQIRLDAIDQMMVASHTRAAKARKRGESPEPRDAGWGLYDASDKAIRLPDGTSYFVQSKPYPRVTDKEANRLWAMANGLEKSLMLWPSTVAKLAIEALLDGQPLPDGVDITVVTVITK